MIIEFEESPDRLTAFLIGDLRWNDRLALTALVPHLRNSLAPEVFLDTSGVAEVDRGCLHGVLGTAERMIRTGGKRFVKSAA